MCIVVPREFKPHPYQPLGIDHLLKEPRCALWAGMGMGKGVMTLSALAYLDMLEDDMFPALAIGPLRVARDVWPKETRKWEHLAHLHTTAVVGDLDQRVAAMQTKGKIYSINYENLEWLVGYWGENGWPYRTVISDESTKLKSYRGSFRTSSTGKEFLQGAGGKRARALAKVAHTKVKHFIELTGTPSPNGLADLWAQIWFLDRGARLGRTYEGFKNRWFTTGYDGHGLIARPGADEEIHDRLKDICLTIDPADWFDLKKPIVNDVWVDLPPAAREHYRRMEKEMFTEIAGHSVEAFGAAARTMKCLQLANGAVYVDPDVTCDEQPKAKKWKIVHDAKLEALESVIAEAEGETMMIVYEFRSELARLMKLLPDSADLGEHKNEVAFKAGEIKYGLCHPSSLGHGVDDLQYVCNRIVFFGHNWSLDTYQQIIERIGPVRQFQAGLDRPVYVTHILARDTVDEMVMERRASKREVQDILLDAMKRRSK